MLFGGGEDKNGMLGRFFQGFQKSIESRCRKHVHLIDNIDFVFSDLWRDSHLINQTSDVVHRIIGSSISLKNIESKILIFFGVLGSVDSFGQNPGTSGFSNSARPGE